jgi:beta-carotene/zeaxanthin 4-ketolase
MGILIAITIIFLWLGHLLYLFFFIEINFQSPLLYLHVLIQAYLYTGLFITAHDAMHGTVAKNRKLNNFIGHLATTLYAFLSYKVLSKKHYLHHRFPASDDDPDFSPHNNNFFVWWFVFFKNYFSWVQILLMAITFNVLLIWFSEVKLIVIWVIPAILSTFQLFFFGTYLPHRRPFSNNMQPHNSRTQVKNHVIAMLSCYFFGYHWEHHESPTTPWWKLYKLKK